MDFLKEINQVSHLEETLPRIPVSSLQINKKYIIRKCSVHETVYGRQVMLHFDEFCSFLPRRVADSITDEKVSDMQNLVMIFLGMKQLNAKGHEACNIKFTKLENTSTSDTATAAVAAAVASTSQQPE